MKRARCRSGRFAVGTFTSSLGRRDLLLRLEPVMRFSRGDVREPYRLIQNRSQISVLALTTDATAERPWNQLSRDFCGCSIFDFCNKIGQELPFPLSCSRNNRSPGVPGVQASVSCVSYRIPTLRELKRQLPKPKRMLPPRRRVPANQPRKLRSARLLIAGRYAGTTLPQAFRHRHR
jgi:hypothetical protein